MRRLLDRLHRFQERASFAWSWRTGQIHLVGRDVDGNLVSAWSNDPERLARFHVHSDA